MFSFFASAGMDIENNYLWFDEIYLISIMKPFKITTCFYSISILKLKLTDLTYEQN